jgi:hypothetical protein
MEAIISIYFIVIFFIEKECEHMNQTPIPNRTDCHAKWHCLRIRAPKVLSSVVDTVGRISLIISTLLVLTSCSSASSAHIHSAATPSVAASTTIANPYPPHQGPLVLNDPLHDDSGGYQWDEEKGNCQFPGGGYHAATSVKLYTYWCAAFATNFSNFAYQAQMTILKGDSGGLMFRADANKSKVDYFRIDQTGYFMFIVFSGHTSAVLLADGTIADFHKGAGQSNLLGVVAQGAHMTLYVNDQSVKTVTNSTLSQGQIGVAASDYDSPVEVVFTDAKVWKL